MVQNVAPLDAVFLSCDTDTTHQAIASLCLLDGIPDYDRFRLRVARLLERFPRLRMKLERGKFLRWVEDPAFRLEEHVGFEYCPQVASPRELLRVVEAWFSKRLDLERPLWRFTVFSNALPGEQKEGGVHAGILFAIHHCLADGLGGLELVEALTGRTAEESLEGELASRRERANGVGSGRATFATRHSASFRQWLSEWRAPKVNGPLNGPNSSSRVLATLDLPLQPLRAAKSRAGVSFNDVMLAVVTGAVQRYHEHAGRSSTDLRALIPVSLRRLSERSSLGNRLTGVGVSLPVRLPSPMAQLEAVNRHFNQLKASGALGAYSLLASVIARLPRSLQRAACEAQARRTSFICTNMPGWSDERYLAGARVAANYGLAALMRGHGVAFGFITYAGNVCISVVGDGAIVEDPWLMVDFLDDSAKNLISGVIL